MAILKKYSKNVKNYFECDCIAWIRIPSKENCWIRIRIEAKADLKHGPQAIL